MSVSTLVTSIRLPTDLHAELRKLACYRSLETGKTIHWPTIAIEILRRHMQKQVT
jgi:hypothetical protein